MNTARIRDQLETVRRIRRKTEHVIRGGEQAMRDGLGPFDLERLRVMLWELKRWERVLQKLARLKPGDRLNE